MVMTSSVTVMVVNWNSGTLLQECLNRLSWQTVMPQRVLVVDNASSDHSAACAEQLAGVELLQMTVNLGFAAGNNRALAECDTEFVALLNPDAFPEPDWLECLLAAANANPDVAAFGSCQLRHGDPEVLDGIGDSYHISGLVWRNRHGARQQPDDLVPQEIFSPCAAAALYRRQALLDVGGFDEDYFCYVEDVDLGFRLRLVGHKAMYVPDAVVHHVGSATTGGQHSDFPVYHGHRNLVWCYVKNMPGPLFWLYLPLHIAANIYIVVRYALKGRWRVILKAKWDAIKGIPRMWAKRKKIQAARVASVRDIWRVLDKRMIPGRHDRQARWKPRWLMR
jgi:GT2 family glycosyltransferase